MDRANQNEREKINQDNVLELFGLKQEPDINLLIGQDLELIIGGLRLHHQGMMQKHRPKRQRNSPEAIPREKNHVPGLPGGQHPSAKTKPIPLRQRKKKGSYQSPS